MPANRLESAGAGAEAGKTAPSAEAPPPAAPPPPPKTAAGLQSWLPLVLTALCMPLLAYATTTFLLLPKLQGSLKAAANAPEEAAPAKPATAEHGASSAPASGKPGSPLRAKTYAQLNKVLVNVAGTMGTRFLVVNITLVSKNSALEANFKENEPELRHVSISCLSSKTINDLEKPGAKNIIRSELTSLFNSVLGPGTVDEIFFTDFAIQ